MTNRCYPRLRCHPEVTSDQTVPDESNLWSDHPRRSWPLIRLMCSQNTVCAECALKMVSDHTIPIRNWSLIRPNSDHCQTIVQPWTRRNPDHCPDDCARQMTSDQTIPRPKMPLIRPSCKDFLTTSRPLSRRLCNHRPDDCARQMTSDQTIPRPKMPLIRPSSKDFLTTSRPLSRRLCNHGPH